MFLIKPHRHTECILLRIYVLVLAKWQSAKACAMKPFQYYARGIISRVTETSTLQSSSSPINATPATVVNSTPSGGQAVRLLMDPRTGRILGTLNQNGTVGPAPPGMSGTAAQPSLRGMAPQQQRMIRPMVPGGRALIPGMPGNVNQVCVL